MEQAAPATRKAFGVLFLCISIAVGSASILSELAYLYNAQLYYHVIIWLACFGVVFAAATPVLLRVGRGIKARMKGSAVWPSGMKALNAVSWAGPFLAIPAFPSLYQYFILLGIGLGNLSTYWLVRKYNQSDNREQLIVASVALASLPAAFAIDTTIFAAQQDVAVMLSRILIALSYGAGGLYALGASDGSSTLPPT